MTFVEVWIYIDCPFSWLLNSLQNYLANSLSWGRYLRYRERIWNELVAKVERICNGPKMILLLRFLTGWAFSECKVTTISPYKKIHEQLFTPWTMLTEVNPRNILKDNKISYKRKNMSGNAPKKVQYIVNLLYTHPTGLPVFFSIIYI